MGDLPSGTVTFLFTDLEGSTRLARELRDRYGHILFEHRTLLREAFEAHRGRVVDTQGDAFFVAFERAKDGLAAALEAHDSLEHHDWPEGAEVRVRFGLHSGEALLGDEGYMGLAVHRAARICSVGNGGQILMSQATAAILQDEDPENATLVDLGEHRLKDIGRPERIFEAVPGGIAKHPRPLRTLDVQPVKATPFAGQERELAAAAQAAVGTRWPLLERGREALRRPAGHWRDAASILGEAVWDVTRSRATLVGLGALVAAAVLVNAWLFVAAGVFYMSQVVANLRSVRFFHSPEGVGWKVHSVARIAPDEALRSSFLELSGALVRAGRVARDVDVFIARAHSRRLAHRLNQFRRGGAPSVWDIRRVDAFARGVRAVETLKDRRQALAEETRRVDGRLPELRAHAFDARLDGRVPEGLLAEVDAFANKITVLGASLVAARNDAKRYASGIGSTGLQRSRAVR